MLGFETILPFLRPIEQGCAGLIGTRSATRTALSSTIWELR